MKFGFIVKHRDTWPVGILCDALGVSRSGLFMRPGAHSAPHASRGLARAPNAVSGPRTLALTSYLRSRRTSWIANSSRPHPI